MIKGILFPQNLDIAMMLQRLVNLLNVFLSVRLATNEATVSAAVQTLSR